MRLVKLELANFRRIESATIHFSPATFLIGPNNCSKSSVIAAIEALLSLDKEKLAQQDILERPDGSRADGASLTATFGGISADVASSRGFRGRVIGDQFIYRKSIANNSSKVLIESMVYPAKKKTQFERAKTIKDLLDGGISAEIIKEALDLSKAEEKLPREWHKALPEAVEFDTSADPTWEANPGGIPQNVLSRLPRVIHIPALTEANEIESAEKKFALGECLSLLFEDLVSATPLAAEIQEKLKALEAEMDPKDEKTFVNKLVVDINKIVSDVFPRCGVSIQPSLSNLLDILRPKYDIKVFSNIKTGAARQGTGLIRTCAFAMLRHHAKLKLQKELQTRPLLVAFEEPELFLHPSAANLLRDTIYALGASDQIVCTTHSPWMIDLTRNVQSITKMAISQSDLSVAENLGVSAAYAELDPDDKDRVKMVQIFDDELSRVFFSEKVIIVEGDSEVLAIRNTLRLLPENIQKAIYSRYQIVKARGKPSIISLVKYLKKLGIDPIILHDGDHGVAGAEKFNKPISDAAGSGAAVVVLNKCLEDALGYTATSGDKPFKAFGESAKWSTLQDVPAAWKAAMNAVFFDELKEKTVPEPVAA